MIFNLGGGGGSAGGAGSFELTVVEGTKPTKVSNNTIWVNTGIKITELNFSQHKPSYELDSAVFGFTSEENVTLYTLDGRNHIKVNGGDAIYTCAKSVNGYWALMLVSPDADAVTTKNSYKSSETRPYQGTVEYEGVTYYWGRCDYGSSGTYNVTPKYTGGDTPEALALLMAKEYHKLKNTVEDGNYNEGTVWIVLDVSGEFKIVSPVGDNWITMYPVSAKQFVGGEWVSVEAHIYQDGVWGQFSEAVSNLYLYNYGNTCDSATGGWVVFNSNSTVTNGSDSMTVRANGSYGAGGAKTANTIDVTDYSTLIFKGAIVSGSSFSDFVIRLTQDGIVKASTPAAEVVNLDVSDLSGEYTIEVYCSNSQSSGRSIKVSEIILVKQGSSGVNLFANGTDATSLTGGWSSKAYSAGSGYVGKTVAVNISSEGVCATLAGTSYHSTFIGTNNKIDVTNYSTLKLEFSEDTNYTKGSGAMKVTLYSDDGYTTVASSDVLPISGNVNLSPEIDVSTLSGEYYIGYFMWTWGTCTISAKMTKANLS